MRDLALHEPHLLEACLNVINVKVARIAVAFAALQENLSLLISYSIKSLI